MDQKSEKLFDKPQQFVDLCKENKLQYHVLVESIPTKKDMKKKDREAMDIIKTRERPNSENFHTMTVMIL